GWPSGEAAACKAVYTGSTPVPTSINVLPQAIVESCMDMLHHACLVSTFFNETAPGSSATEGRRSRKGSRSLRFPSSEEVVPEGSIQQFRARGDDRPELVAIDRPSG